MRQIPLGTKGTFTLRVLPEHLANQFKDAMLPQVPRYDLDDGKRRSQCDPAISGGG
jgi:hypothetical protein